MGVSLRGALICKNNSLGFTVVQLGISKWKKKRINDKRNEVASTLQMLKTSLDGVLD